ncbi:amino acid adenylation domain-containing protein [Kitasatospora sp. NPDC093806]|uniref:non-ribosomal peptide synthetase n=1 Tax=Kitasatospora sp. NPDC093806 TaxID=3155075 RepID=UPI00343F94AC
MTEPVTEPVGSVVTLVERWCLARPAAVAVELPDGTGATYAELHRRVGRILTAIRPAAAGDRPVVAVDLPNGLDFCATVLAVLAGGATLLTVDRTLPAARLATMMSRAEPRLLVTDRTGDALPWAPPSMAVLRLGAEEAGLEETGETVPVDGWGAGPEDPDAPAYVIFTSGTTGIPKAAVNTHTGLLSHMLFVRETCPLPPGSRVLLKSARSFDAWLLEFFWALTQGVTLVLADEERATDAGHLAAELADRSIHALVAVPSLLKRIFDVLARTGGTTALRYVVSAGEPLRAALAEQILSSGGTRLFNFYGPAEAAIDVAYHEVTRDRIADPVPIGRAIPGNRLTVRGPDGTDITRTGAKGELVVTGAHVGLGYAGDDHATAARFATAGSGERSYATGDLAFLGPDGDFYIGGRMDSQVKINGVRIETEEIEAHLLRHETVADCTVQVTHSGDSPVLVAFIKANGQAAAKSEYINHLRGLLPPVMVPPAYVFVDDFGVLPSGKKDTSRLEFPRGLPTVTAAEFEAPDGELEQGLAEIWESVLQVSPIGAVDDFSLVGGESLKMIDVLVKVSDSVYPDIFTLRITKLSTVRDLARKIQTAKGA